MTPRQEPKISHYIDIILLLVSCQLEVDAMYVSLSSALSIVSYTPLLQTLCVCGLSDGYLTCLCMRT